MINAAIFGAGFIGQSFISSKLSFDYKFTVLDRNKKPSDLNENIIWKIGDTSNYTDVKAILGAADIAYYFIHDNFMSFDPKRQINANFSTLAVDQFLKACVQNKIKRVIFISSASVYGNQSKLPIYENSSTDPISTYGIYKLIMEKFFILYKNIYGLDCKIIRLSNPYGPRQYSNKTQGIIAIAIEKCLSDNVVEIRGNGLALRDFIYIDDVIRALDLLSKSSTNEVIFNIGSGQGVSLNFVLKTISEKIGKTIKIQYSDAIIEEISASELEISKAQNLLNFKPKISLQDGISKMIEFA